jgi:hypothetical protein
VSGLTIELADQGMFDIPFRSGVSNNSPNAVERWLASWVAFVAKLALGARAGPVERVPWRYTMGCLVGAAACGLSGGNWLRLSSSFLLHRL